MTKEKQVRKNYAGTEQSPYWEYLARKGNFSQKQDHPEITQANPDMLAENKAMFHRDNQAVIDSEAYQKILRLIPTLSVKQREALQLVGYEGRSYAEAGKIMGVSKSRIRDLIREVRRKLQ